MNLELQFELNKEDYQSFTRSFWRRPSSRRRVGRIILHMLIFLLVIDIGISVMDRLNFAQFVELYAISVMYLMLFLLVVLIAYKIKIYLLYAKKEFNVNGGKRTKIKFTDQYVEQESDDYLTRLSWKYIHDVSRHENLITLNLKDRYKDIQGALSMLIPVACLVERGVDVDDLVEDLNRYIKNAKS